MNEIWIDIFGYEKLYQVSSYGKIKSLNYKRMNTERILAPNKDKDGYLLISLSKNGIVKKYKIHQLVLTHFVGPKPFDKAVSRHMNNKRDDNLYTNLQWSTKSENQKDRILNNTVSTNLKLINQFGSNNRKSKLNNDKVLEIRNLIKNNYSDSEIADLYGVLRKCINDVRNHKTWNHII